MKTKIFAHRDELSADAQSSPALTRNTVPALEIRHHWLAAASGRTEATALMTGDGRGEYTFRAILTGLSLD